MIVVCEDCGRQTTTLEANARRFAQGACGACGGRLWPTKPRDLHVIRQDVAGAEDGVGGTFSDADPGL